MKNSIIILAISFFLLAMPMSQAQQPAAAAPAPVSPLDKLLEEVRQSIRSEGVKNAAREREFRSRRDQQKKMLAEAKAALQRQEQRSDRLKKAYDANEKRLAELTTVLEERQGNLGEMFGVVRQVAGDAKSQFQQSITSSQFPGRTAFLADLAQSKELPSIEQLRTLWYEIQREITEQGKVVSYSANVMRESGQVDKSAQVTRVGIFNAISNGKFLQWNFEQEGLDEGVLVELPRQPADRFLGQAEALESLSSGFTGFPADPTRGVILSLVVQSPSLEERIAQGKEIGYVILIVGIVGLLITAYRYTMLTFAGMGIKSQLKSNTPSSKNALGRIMSVYAENPEADFETLELKLDEAIMKETPSLESGLSIIKIIYVTAPLLGLLGTVTGMIETFQQITLFGTGDPKMMAGGISAALVTTMLGLIVAIPLTFLHSVLQSKSRSLIHILEEQSAGVIARLAER